MCVLAVHINLVELWEVDVEVGCAELVDLLNGARSLLSELVAREVKNLEALTVILLVEWFQVFVLRCEPASGGCVDNQQHLPFVV